LKKADLPSSALSRYRRAGTVGYQGLVFCSARRDAEVQFERTVTAVASALLLIASAVTAAAQSIVTELPLEDGGIQRVLYGSPACRRAALIMLPGGNGMVEFGPDGTFHRVGGSLLLRTLPLMAGSGVCRRRSLDAKRHVLMTRFASNIEHRYREAGWTIDHCTRAAMRALRSEKSLLRYRTLRVGAIGSLTSGP
jgi:hypothetical protein